MLAECKASATKVMLYCHLGLHNGVLHYDEEAGIWWAEDVDVATFPPTPRPVGGL